jgi:hypothetical protein
MSKFTRVGAASIALSFIASDAMAAAANCARPAEAAALHTASVQQQLMVAALSCNAIPLYNQFVTTYQKDLFAADRNLQAYFKRLDAAKGTSNYHAFKTKLANSSSRTSISHMTNFCDKAQEMFKVALAIENKPTLSAFVDSQPYIVDIAECEPTFRMAGAIAPEAPAATPVVTPAAVVTPAQGGAQ